MAPASVSLKREAVTVARIIHTLAKPVLSSLIRGKTAFPTSFAV